MTIPLRLYHTPSFVRHASSASIFAPLTNTITGLPPCRVPIPGPLVETGSLVARECAVETLPGEVFGDAAGDGEGDGELSSEGEGVATAEGSETGTL